MWIDEAWIAGRVTESSLQLDESDAVARLRLFFVEWAIAFAEHRTDVGSPTVTWPRRGLVDDEAASFLRAVDMGLAEVDDAGYVTLPTVRPKAPPGRYALLGKSGSSVSINLEYLIQIGATAELVLDHGWSPNAIDFERGEFDAIGLDEHGHALLVMETKARVTGPDSLEKLLTIWLRMAQDHTIDLNNNAGRKYRDLLKRCHTRPVVVWLVAAGARWTLIAELKDGSVRLAPASEPSLDFCREPGRSQEATMHEALPYDARHHRPGTSAAAGRCSWHGRPTCEETPVVSFQDNYGWWQSGCQRALDELVARGEITPPQPVD